MQARLALLAIAGDPLAGAAQADAGGVRRCSDRPALLDHPARELAPSIPTESGVTVELHPESSLDWGAWQLPASREARMNQRPQELQLAASLFPARRSRNQGRSDGLSA